ncbi:hypothetical protein BH11PSE11_BH11PSE11_03500 [soil metagenome]
MGGAESGQPDVAGAKTFVDLLSRRAASHPDRLAFRYLSYPGNGVDEELITFRQLDARVNLIARRLLEICEPGDRALLLYPSGIDFIAAYFGCLYAGVIAVPGYPPKRNQKLGRLKSLVQNCQAKVAMTDSQTQVIAQPQFGEVDELASLSWLITDTLVAVADVDSSAAGSMALALPRIDPEDIAFLQYTSGSTGDPKGVMVSHRNLVENSRSIYVGMGHDASTLIVGWTPLFHDMGLIGNVLQPVYAGITGTFMSPASFLQRPMRWLEAVSKYRGTTSGGPNFAYDLCVSSIKDEDLTQLDLRSWNVAFNGAEPIRPESIRAFSKKFADCGFDDRAHYPCYGMAETTLMITAGAPGKGTPTLLFDEAQLQKNQAVLADDDASAAASHELVDCGFPKCEQGVLIVDPVTLQRCVDGAVGEIWVHGSSNAQGYWQKPEATAATFAAHTAGGEGPFLRTGDLGFLHQGSLFVSGRLKDVVIIRGMNHYPQDIELTAFESHEAFMPNGAAVFTVEQGGQEQLVIVLEVRRTFLRNVDPDALAMAIQQAVVLQHELQVQSIVFIKPGQLPKTSSGKVQRQACKLQYLAGEIEHIGRVDKAAEIAAAAEIERFDRGLWQDQSEAVRVAMLETYLAGVFESFARLAPGSINRDAAFIGYGLDSLALTQIAARIGDDLDCGLQVQHMFECGSITALARHLTTVLQDPASRRQRILPAAALAEKAGSKSKSRPNLQRYPLSFAQQRIWFLMQYEASSLYNISGVLHMVGDLDLAALDRSFQEVIRRHDALRTRFVEEEFEPVQLVARDSDWKLSFMDLSDRSKDELDAEIGKELGFVFDLSEDILFRATLYKLADGEHELVVCMHHIISDGWSIGVLMRELSALYPSYASGRTSAMPTLAPLAIQYPDYAVWQRDLLQGELLAQQEHYWQSQLQGVAPLALARDKIRPTQNSYAGHSLGLHLDPELTAGLKTLSRENGVTLYMTLLASFGVLLHKYSGQSDICIGTPIANRTALETRELMGFFVNTLALRSDFSGDPVFADLLQKVKGVAVDAFAHQDLPFEKVVDLVQPERDMSTSPIFQVMFVLQENEELMTLPGMQISKQNSASSTSKFDITLELRDGPNGLVGHIEYKTELFDELTMRRLGLHFKRLLAEIVAAPHLPLSRLSLLDQDERHCLLELWNDTEKNFRQPQRLHEMFSAQVARTSEAVALVANGQEISFAELDRRANQLAHLLIASGMRGNALVALCVERSVDMVVGMIAVLKAGGAYVPLDPGYPVERLSYMLEHSQARVLIIQASLSNLLQGSELSVVTLDENDRSATEAMPVTAPQIDIAKSDCAYVIYTSGSTGRPKGVTISHAAICNQMAWILNQFPMQASDRILQKTPFSFDASVWEIWAPLVSGAQLVLAAPDGHKDVDYIVNAIIEEKITVIQMVPALLRAMLAVPAISRISSLRRMFLGGEALPVDLAKQALAFSGRVINLYGPTECSINASFYDAGTLADNAQAYVPIGKPVSNLQFYVLDGQRCLVPVGVPGELYVAGIGLSDGYLHQPELTQERFIANPFNTANIQENARLYRTGDLVRYGSNGQLEFIARVDEQIKIRGFRIELGEIESVLAKYPGVKDSAVAVKGRDGNQRLVAYVVAAAENFSLDALRSRLAKLLPEYMVPSVFVTLPALPLNQSGKVDRKALPEPQKPNFKEYQPLVTSTEIALAKIWRLVLEIDPAADSDQVHAKSNFFAIGGHSLLAARMAAQIRERWKIEFAIRNVFEAQELHALAALIEKAAGVDDDPIERVTRDAPLLLSYAQQRLWILNQIDSNLGQYNMPAAIELHGSLDDDALQNALGAFVDRHEILRTVYAEHDGLPYQVIRAPVHFSLKKIDLGSLNATDQQNALNTHSRQEATTPFNLAQDLMLRARLLRHADEHHTLLITLHHIASDGWSTTVLVKELGQLYEAFYKGLPAELPALACQYADYAAWQRKTLSGEKLAALLAWWSATLRKLPTVHNLPLDHARPAQPSYRGGLVTQTLSAATVAGLRRIATDSGATLFMVLHAAFAALLHRYSGEDDIVIGTPVGNRERLELEPLVGLFVNTLVVRSDFSEDFSFSGLLEQSRKTLLDAYAHQGLPFDLLVNELHTERSQSFNPVFQVMLVMQNGADNQVQLSGLQASAIRETAGTTKFDLTLNIAECGSGGNKDGGEVKASWEYAKDLFDEATIATLAHSFATMLDAIVLDADMAVNRLPLVAAAEREVLLANSNAAIGNVDDAFPPICSHVLFEAQAARTPNATAVCFNDERLTYQELNRRANQLAHHLVARGVTCDTLVGLCVDRSPDMVVGLLAILKAGGAYVAFDPTYPSERLRYLLQDSAVQIVVTQKSLLELVPFSGQRTIFIDNAALFESMSVENIPVADLGLTPESLAYVIYTSGSTGNPKASLLMHKGLSNLAQAQIEFFKVNDASRVIQFASFAFDAATSEIFMALAAGAELHVVAKELAQSGSELSSYVQHNRITHATLPPALLPVLEREKWRSVLHLVVAGEHCPIGLVKEWAQERNFYNAYGPSETTVCASMARLTPACEVVHMGKPMRGVQLYVLDELMQPTPIGVAGQLYVGGRGVGRGYLGRDALNLEKFVANPFATGKNPGKLYATGDLARWLNDGNVEYIGRLDNQVKLRGFRIELGEVEATLRRQPGVLDASVAVHADHEGSQRLVAYIVVNDESFSTDALRQDLARSMPAYMLPAVFIPLDSFPLTPNGKLDKKALPAPDVNSLVKVDFVAPRDQVEQDLAAIWCELLGLERVGIHHNFFDLGGHSLLAIRAISRIKEKFGVQLKVADLFIYTNIASLARKITAAPAEAIALPLVEPRTIGNILPLSLEQQGYWFLYELEGGTATYNIPTALRLTGKLNIDALEQSFISLIQRHESLRTVLLVENGAPSQQILDSASFAVSVTNKKENRYKEVLDQQVELDARYVFDLKKEIPIRAVLHKLYDDDFVLTILLHHTMADGWSLDILVRELAELYNAFSSGKTASLPSLPVQYGDYAVWQKQHLAGAYYEKEVAYWRDALKGLPPLIDLPTDYPRPPVQSYRGKEVGFVLPFQLTQALTAFSRKNKTTLFNTLLSGLNVLLSRYSRSEDVAIGTAIANRSQSSLESLIGCFANTLVIRTRLEQDLSFVDLVKRVNGTVFDAYEHAGIPFDVVVDAVQPVRSLGVPPIFQVMFRLHNQKAGQGIGFDGLHAERLTIQSESAKLDLNFSLIETDGSLEGVIEYATDLFSEKTVKRIARHFQLLLESAMAKSNTAIASLDMLSKEEFALVEKWNDTTVPYPDHECVYQLFEKNAARMPDKLAYVCGAERYTYAELNAQANRLAHWLKTQGVGPEVRVGLSVDRSVWAGISTLAIFKAGGTYVPLDPKYPVERLEVMLDVVRPKLILTVAGLADRFAAAPASASAALPMTPAAPAGQHGAQIICLDRIAEALAAQPSTNLRQIGAAHSAYILFTSGTTGRPKAILVSHRSFRNMVVAHKWAKLHAADSRVLQFASLSFSISLWDSFMAWAAGGTLYSVNNDESLPGEALYDLLQRESITHATWPVSLLSTLPVERMPASLRTIISSAEPCNDAVVARWTRRGVRFLNMYGNSEVSLGSTLYEYRKVGQKLTIGVAFPNTRMYLLDKYLRQVPIGVIAEIHTAGAGLATCYWNNPEATAASFIPNPFARNGAERLYKTGDLGRYLPNGEIEFIGREDFQVSIRGFRVELTEIENILRTVAGIAEVVVVSQPDANQLARLVCFYVEKEDSAGVTVADLRQLVSRKLPGYMVPSLFVRLDAMPLTPNRKVDRLGLPKPSLDDQQQGAHVAPRTPLETSLAAIWSDVLNMPEIGVDRNFFEVGGHSLLAVQVVARVKESLGLPISIKDLFVHTTIESLATHLATLDRAEVALLPPIEPRAESGLIPLSLDQKPYWFLHQLEGGSHTYNIPLAMRLHGDLNVAALQESFLLLLQRHESLRTLFPVHDGEPAQKILSAAETSAAFFLQVLNLKDGAGDKEAMRHVLADFTHVFDLAVELPIRIRLLKLDGGAQPSSHIVTLVMHHAVADGWSLNILMRELIALYEGIAAGQGNPLAPLALQYGDYSQWQQQNILGDFYNRQITFWKGKLGGLAPLLNLPLDYPRPPMQSYRGKEQAISLPFALTAKLNQYARQHNTTLYNVLLSGLAILLSRYGRTDDIPVGTAIANRPQKELEPLIGCFANTLVIRCRVNPKESFQKLVAAVSNEAIEAFAHGSVPFDGVVEAVQPERSLGVPPIFQVMFRLHNQQMAQTESFAGLRSELLNIGSQSAKLDLNFSLVEKAEGLGGVIEYATDIFNEQTIVRIAAHYQTILEAAIRDSSIPIENLSILTRAEMEQVEAWNATEVAYPQDECMHHLFERTVQRTPNKLAYVCGEERYTYAELNAKANRLAHFLRSRGAAPEVGIGVCFQRSTWAGIGALAAAKSGGVYVPLDASYPKDRLKMMLEVAKPKIILTLSATASLFEGCGAEVVCLDTDWQAVQSQPVANTPNIGADHSAYILFTSGTTGRPKGILVSHRSFRNMAVSQQWAGLYSSESRVLQFASHSFSISIWGSYMAFAPGGTIYSVTAEQALPDEPLYEMMEAAQITHVTWPVSMLTTIPIERMPKSLHTVISSAEPCNDAVVDKWTGFGCRFLNLYGNSEVAIGSTLYEYHSVGEKLTIGKALPNTQMYLLDENLKQVPIGVIAEIHTAGVGLATCYVGDPEATAKSFIPNPFSDDPSSRMYKTGDLGRYLPNGEIEFIGREDFQVNIRGFRVELSEIEDVLRAVPGVLEVVVVTRNDQQGLARLVCFYTQDNKFDALNTTQLRKAVSEKLPNYMVPAMFFLLDAMPLTPNRKIDRMALPQTLVGDAGDDKVDAPESPTEKSLAAIWSGILDIAEVGIHQDFFELGGHSLLATKIVARIRSEFKVDISLQQFFENATIEGLAALIAQARSSYVDSPIRLLANRERVPLSFAQQRLWFLDRYEENSNFYHMPSVMKITGELDIKALNDAFVNVIARHEVLRTNFIASEGQAYQKIRTLEGWSLELVDVAGETAEEQEHTFADYLHRQLNTSFDLQSDALLRVVLYVFSDDECRLFINMHHIISDGWSITVLINEITSLYESFVNNQPAALKPLPVQYADYSAWQIEYLQGAVLARQSNYWTEKLADLSTLRLPLDFERPKNQTYHGDRLNFDIDRKLVEALEALSSKQGTTLFMTLLSAFNVLLHKYSGHSDICIGTPIANRVRAELEPMVGFFANTLVLRSDLDGNPEFSALLQQVKSTTLGAYSHQDLPFEKVVDLVLPERDPSRSPLFQVSFALQSFPETEFALPGITLVSQPLVSHTAKFDLLLEILTSSERMSGSFEYNTDLFLPQTIESFASSFICLLQSIVADPQCRLSELALTDASNEDSRGTLVLAEYPLLDALYGNLVGASTLDYSILDDRQQPVPAGVIGKLYLDLPQSANGAEKAGRFKARQMIGHDASKHLVLLSAIDDVALVNNRLVYPRAIEQCLLARPGMRDCHVSVRAHGQLGDQLVVYAVFDGIDGADAGQDVLDENEINAYLHAQMHQNDIADIAVFAVVAVTHIPLTRYGEVNLRNLYRHAVHNRRSREAWSGQIKSQAGVEDAIFISRSSEAPQSVSHLQDLLPDDALASGGNKASAVTKGRKTALEAVSTVPALVMSEAIKPVAHQPATMADIIFHTVAAHADKLVRFYRADDSVTDLSYAQLLQNAQCVLGGLRDAGLAVGDKVIFQFDSNVDFVVAFWACQLGGLIPVPIAPAKNFRKSNPQTAKVAHAWRMIDKAVVLAGAKIIDGVENIAKLESIADFAVLDMSLMAEAQAATEFHQGAAADVALIMLTSGSTGLPKGVQLSHANLIGRTMGSVQKNGFNADMVTLNWMALDHVGGIIYFHIRDTYLGAEQIQADTDYILVDPLRWLQLIDRHRVNVTWAPNFAFSLLVERQDELKKLALDLSCMQFMLNGAEAVVPKTTQAFIELMQAFNMPEDAVKPVYGMSEISSGVTYSKRLQLTYGSDDTVFVSVGAPIPGVNMRIVDENDQLKMEGQSGRLQVSGVTVTRGYLGGAEINKEVFTEDGWFKTGDLAFLDGGELTITGREKDIIIINGVNFYSHEIEAVVQDVPGVVVSYTGACAVRRNLKGGGKDAAGGSDQLAIFFHSLLKGEALLAQIQDIRKLVIEKVGINPTFIIPLEKEQVPKTEIGKIQLSKLALAFNRGDFDHVLKALDIAQQNEHTLPDWFFTKVWVQRNLGKLAEISNAETSLVFADAAGCASSLALRGKVITVTRGDVYLESADGYQIDPTDEEHYTRLLESLKASSITLDRVLNLWDYDPAAAGADSLLSSEVLPNAAGLYAAWNLARALAAQGQSEPMRWIWCARKAQRVTADETGEPARAAAAVLLKTLAKEHAWLTCHHVDLDGEDAFQDAALVRKEAGHRYADEEVAYRSARRLVLRLKNEQPARTSGADKTQGMPIMRGAAYVIAGGMGGIAYDLSRMLLKQFGARLLLIGRTPLADLSADKQDALEQLATLGSVRYASADVSDFSAIDAAVETAELEWKQKLGGVFHLAGLAEEQLVAQQSIEALHHAIRVKTIGTRNLYALCARRRDTLFVNFSSVNGFFGGSGMAAYNVGNAYQSNFIESVQGNRNVKSFCFDWSLWHDTGMGSRYKQVESLSKALGFKPILAAKGIFSLLTALYHDKRSLLIGLDDTKQNVGRLSLNTSCNNQQLACYFVGAEAGMANQVSASKSLIDEFALPLTARYVQLEALPRTNSGEIDLDALHRVFAQSAQTRVEKVAPRDELEETLTRIASEVFGAAEPIGIKDNFFDVGANSLLIVKMHHEIQLQLNIEFAMVELFNSTTVEKLAAFLGQQGSKGGDSTADAARAAGQDRRAAMQRRNQARGRKRA